MVIEKGYAKINLGLEVLRKREDGYHDLDMIMTSVNLYDELYFEDNLEGNNIIIECETLKHLNPESNLVYKAIMILRERFGIKRGVKVRIVKRIPEQAGLGGGSADCAATLRAMNKLWSLGLSDDDLAKIGFELGSDVPFCIYNRTARVKGRGEKLEFIEDMPFTYLILVLPPFRNSTAEIFRNFSVHHENSRCIEDLQDAVGEGALDQISENLFNDLEKGVKRSEIAEVKRDLLTAGALGSVMSGSGPAVFGLCLNSERNAQHVLQRFINLIKKKYPQTAQKWEASVQTIRSSRRAKKTSFEKEIKSSKKANIIAQTESKAYAMLPLGYQKILNHSKIILTPLSLWDNVIIQKFDQPYSELIFTDGSSRKELEIIISEISKLLGYGLRITIKESVRNKFGLISNDNYLCTIINALADFGSDTEKLFSLFSNRVRLYKDNHTVVYDSKTDKFKDFGNAVFGYVLLVDLNLKNYQSPRHTRQADTDTSQLEAVLEGISEENFYKMATNAFNGIEKFEARKIGDYKGRNYLEKIKNIALNNGATGVYLALDGLSLIIICRYEKQVSRINRLLKFHFKLNDNLETLLKTEIVHQQSKSKILKVIPSSSIDEEYEYDESSPFENFEEGVEYPDQAPYRKRKKRKMIEVVVRDQDCEGLLLLNSGGSIFKQYDFIDIAHYFQRFFGGKYINFNLNGVDIPVEFKTEHLPHILGIHLLNEGDPSLRGRAGFERLLAGDIFYRKIRNSGKVCEKTIKTIVNKTQSSVMIFNDIFHNRLDCFYCFPREIIVRGDTKMDKFEFGVTRMLTGSSFHRQNLLGIGKDQRTNKYFFYTSFIWQVPAHIGKKDSYRILIS